MTHYFAFGVIDPGTAIIVESQNAEIDELRAIIVLLSTRVSTLEN